METNSIRKRELPIWEYLSLPAHYFCTGTPHMEMVILFLATSKSRVEEHIPPNFGQEIKIFPLSHDCDITSHGAARSLYSLQCNRNYHCIVLIWGLSSSLRISVSIWGLSPTLLHVAAKL